MGFSHINFIETYAHANLFTNYCARGIIAQKAKVNSWLIYVYLRYISGATFAAEGGIMTIHHDKLAYGKLAPSSEELTEEKIAEMLAKLSKDEEDGDKSGNKEDKTPQEK